MSFNITKYKEIKDFIADFRAINKKTSPISIIPVSKNQSIETIKKALGAGIRIFGENRVQEAEVKFKNLKNQYKDLELHMIGSLQTNKVTKAIKLFDCFHTLDRESLAKEFVKCLQKENLSKFFFIQVNTGLEKQKGGIDPKFINEFIKYCTEDLKLNVIGLMCMPPIDQKPKQHFLMLRKMALDNHLQNLSMGMSKDYEIALSCGATHIRLGTCLFGERL